VRGWTPSGHTHSFARDRLRERASREYADLRQRHRDVMLLVLDPASRPNLRRINCNPRRNLIADRRASANCCASPLKES
jgi:hypothetical protein